MMEKILVKPSEQKLADLRAERDGLRKAVEAGKKATASFSAFDAHVEFETNGMRCAHWEHALREVLAGRLARAPSEAAMQKKTLGSLATEIGERGLPKGETLEERILPRMEALEESAKRKVDELKVEWDFSGMKQADKAQIRAERKLMKNELDAELFSLAVLKAYCFDRGSMQKLMRQYYEGLESKEEHGNFVYGVLNYKPRGTPAEVAAKLSSNSANALALIESAEKVEKAEGVLREKEMEITKHVDGMIAGMKEAGIRDVGTLSGKELDGLAAFWKKYREGSEAQWMLAQIYFKMGRWDDALDAVDEKIMRDEAQMKYDAEMEGLRLKIEICQAAGPEYAKAREDAEKMLAEDTNASQKRGIEFELRKVVKPAQTQETLVKKRAPYDPSYA